MKQGPASLTTSATLRAGAAARPESEALLGLDRAALTYRELSEFCARAAATLAGLGIRPGDNVAIAMPNGPEMATAFLSVTHLATAAPLNPGLREAEFAFYLKDLGARAVLVAEPDSTAASAAASSLDIPVIRIRATDSGPAGVFAVEPALAASDVELPAAKPDDVALVLHTSGTTAKPKIVPLSQRNLCISAANVSQTLELQPEDRCLNVMPLFHIHGLVAALLATLRSGGSIVCTPGYQAPDFFSWFYRTSPTWYTAVPTMHQGILARAGDLDRERVRESRLRFIRSSSASLPPPVLRQLEEAFDVPVIEAYGMTEAAHQMASNPLPPGKCKPGSVGPAAGPEVAVASAEGKLLANGQTGEVVIRGSNVTHGYHGVTDQSENYFREGWFRTGDQGYLDADGYLFLTGRLKEIINRGGETIAPREIDEALLEHPEVLQAVAFSVPDPGLGEEVAAAVVLAAGSEASEADLHAFLEDRLSWARMPKRILIVDAIPKGPTGKLQRIGLADKLGLASARKIASPAAIAHSSRSDESSSATLDLVTKHWREALKVDDVDPDESFLDAGGDSLTATALVLRLEKGFSVKLPLITFFDAATIRRQAELIDGLLADPGPGNSEK